MRNIKKYVIKTLWSISVILSVNVVSQAQEHPDYIKWKAKYPEEQLITLKKQREIEVFRQSEGLSININHFENIYYLGEGAAKYAKEQVYSSEFMKTENIKAYTNVPKKKKYKQIVVTDFKESFDKNSSSFYDDTRVTHFTFPAVEKGVQTVLEYQQKISDPHFTGSLFFESFMPSEEVTYKIKVPENVKLNYKVFNDNDEKIKVSVSNENDFQVFTFSMTDIPALKYESSMPNWKYITPHVAYQIDSYVNETNNKISVLSSVNALYDWYYTFLERIGEEDMELMHETVSQIVEEKDSELEKAKKIFYWVQHNIKYIAFEDGMRGFIPHSGAYVCEKKYGDCKDMASIIVSLFKAAGLEANYTWVGTRDLPYTYEELPSPSVDNHMIATFENDGKIYFLDATSQYSPFNMPSSMIQGKQVLVSKSKQSYELKTVPVIDKVANQAIDSMVVDITEDGSIQGKAVIQYTGFQKVSNTYRLTGLNTTEVSNTLDVLLEKGSNKFNISDYKIENINDLEKPLKVSYTFDLPDHASVIGDEVYMNLNIENNFSGKVITEDRVHPIENDYNYQNESYIAFNVPENFEIAELPENTSYSNDIFGFEITYEKKGNKLVRKEKYFVNYLLLQPDQFDLWNKGIKSLQNSYSEVVVLKKKN